MPCNDLTTQYPVTSPTQAPGSEGVSVDANVEASNAAADRIAEVEGEKNAAFIKFVSDLPYLEKSFLLHKDIIEKSAAQSNVLSQPIVDNDRNSIHPMALQVKGKEALEDEVTSAYFEDEIDLYNVEKGKKMGLKGKDKSDEKVRNKSYSRSHSHGHLRRQR